jgi:hypothetical protein
MLPFALTAVCVVERLDEVEVDREDRGGQRVLGGAREVVAGGALVGVAHLTITYRVFVSGSRSMPLVEWFSSERGSPRMSWTWSQLDPFQVSFDRMPELVSRFESSPTAIRQSDDVT